MLERHLDVVQHRPVSLDKLLWPDLEREPVGRVRLDFKRQLLARYERQPGDGLWPPHHKAFTLVLALAGRETMQLGHDRLGTQELLLGLAREGEGVAARVLQELGGGLLELREAVAAQDAAGVDPEPFPPDRGPPPWQPPRGARLRRVIPLARQHRLPSGDQLVLISLEV